MTFNDINNFLISQELSDFLLPFKVVAIIVSIFFIIYIAYYVIMQPYVLVSSPRRAYSDFSEKAVIDRRRYTLTRWREIIKAMQKKDEINYKLAVLNMDGMLFDIFKALKYQGLDLGEMLTEIREKKVFDNPETPETIYYLSRKMRNDPSYKIDPQVIEQLATEVSNFLIKIKLI
jgi:hypothetical protein